MLKMCSNRSIAAIFRTATTELPFPNSDGDGTLSDVNIPQSDTFPLPQYLNPKLFSCLNTSIRHFSFTSIPQSQTCPLLLYINPTLSLASIPQSDTFYFSQYQFYFIFCYSYSFNLKHFPRQNKFHSLSFTSISHFWLVPIFQPCII